MTAVDRPDNGHDEGRELPSVATSQAQCDIAEVLHEDGTLVWGVALIKAQQILDRRRPAVADDQRREQECSASCSRRICEWCPGQDRYEAAAQRLYTMVIARQEGIPADDVTPWSDLTAFKRNGWRGWIDELLSLLGQDGSETGGERRG